MKMLPIEGHLSIQATALTNKFPHNFSTKCLYTYESGKAINIHLMAQELTSI